jgi:TPR repeat protein
MRRVSDAQDEREGLVTSANSSWISVHGRLWYDEPRYRLAWLVWPQALIAALVLLLWASPPSVNKNVPWAKPVDSVAMEQRAYQLREKARSDQSAMDQLERDARGGDMSAEFYYGTLLDPTYKLSSIVAPDFTKAKEWYERSAAQGHGLANGNLAVRYSDGGLLRIDYMRSCFYARKLDNTSPYADSVRVKGDCYARGLGGTPLDLTQAAAAYEMASSKGVARASAALGYFYENGLGGKPRDPAMAVKLYKAAADAGDSLGLHNLGFSYNAGTLGLQRDAGEASRLIYQALKNRYDFTYQSLTQQPQLWTPDFWKNLQQRLGDERLYDGWLDGRPNPATLEAIRRLSGH